MLSDFSSVDVPVAIADASPTVSLSVNGFTASDSNNDNSYDKLLVNATFTTNVVGGYYLIGALCDSTGTIISAAGIADTFNAKNNTVSFEFDGKEIYQAGIDGQYTFAILVFDSEGFLVLENNAVSQSSSFNHTQFAYIAGSFNGNFSSETIEETLNVSVDVNVAQSGNYVITAVLENSTGSKATVVSVKKTLNIGNQTLTLNFATEYLEAGGQWRVSLLQLRDADSDELLDVFEPFSIGNYNLAAVSQGKSTVTLQWNPINGVNEYTLQRNSGNGWVTIYTGNKTSFVDSGLSANKSYSYRVLSDVVTQSASVVCSTLSSSQNDVPAVIRTTQTNNQTTLEWANLGNEYTYYIFKNGNLVTPTGQKTTTYVDAKPAVTTEYYVYAYNANMLKGWSHALPVVVTLDQSPVKAEILSHEIMSEDGIKLNWSITNAQQFVVFRNGIPVSSNANSQTLTDTSPKNGNNEYVLYVGYLNEVGRTVWTWSSPYVVTTTTSSAAPSANALDTFWADYDFNLIDDDVLNAIT